MKTKGTNSLKMKRAEKSNIFKYSSDYFKVIEFEVKQNPNPFFFFLKMKFRSFLKKIKIKFLNKKKMSKRVKN